MVIGYHQPNLSTFFFHENVQPMSNFFLECCHSFDQSVTGLCMVQFCLYHTHDWQTGFLLQSSQDSRFTSMTADQIGLHSVLII